MDPAVIKIKQARLQILMAMNMTYPAPLMIATVFRVLLGTDATYAWGLMERDVHYLIAKGYLAFVDAQAQQGLDFKKKVIELTGAGKDIADRTDTDPTLEI